MAKALKVRFEKFHGLGNDFLVIHGRGLRGPLAEFAQAITERHTGVGADGLVVVAPPRSRGNQARVRFFNADGSEAEMSGNGIRCAAAFLAGGRRTQRALRIETAAGVKPVQCVGKLESRAKAGGWIFEVGMGAPILEPRKIPMNADDFVPPVVGFPLRTERGLLPVTVTSMGNPHCTVFVADFESFDWPRLGREIERNPVFPRRTNVEFVKVVSKSAIQARFWERGVGQTRSSGTGSCGAVAACILNGLTRRKVRVQTLAGNLEVRWPENGEISLTGPVEKVAEGLYIHAR